VYHLTGTREQDWCRLLPDYADCEAADMRPVSARDWVQMVKDVNASQSLPFATYLADIEVADIDAAVAAGEQEHMEICSHRTVRALENLGIKEPKVSSDAWLNYLERLFESEQRLFHRRRQGRPVSLPA
jgi:hypothetical protein